MLTRLQNWMYGGDEAGALAPVPGRLRSDQLQFARKDADFIVGDPSMRGPAIAYTGFVNRRAAISEGLCLWNGRFRLPVSVSRGMGLCWASPRPPRRGNEWATKRPTEEAGQFGWKAPIGDDPVHPSLLNLAARNGLGWLDGFNELLTRCGLSWMGPPGDDPGGNPTENPLTLHGRIANMPADRWEMRKEPGDPGSLVIEGEVSERTLFGSNLALHARYEAEVGSPELHLTDTVTNAGDTPAEMMLLYHINQTPLGSRVIVPCEEVIPRDARAAEGGSDWEGPENWATLGPPTPGFAEQAYFIRPRPDADGRGRMLMPADDDSVALEVRFDVDTLPWCVLWKQFGGRRDGYVVGMEPATCLPNHRSFERTRGRVIVLQPDERQVMRLTLRFLTEPDEVREVVEQAQALAADPPTVHSGPLPEYCQSAG